MHIKDHQVLRLWVEHASDIAEEYYASFTLDRPAKLHLCMVSAKGGVDIEEVAETDPDAIARMHVDPVDGIDLDQAAKIVAEAGLNEAARDAGSRDTREALRLLREGRLRPRRDKPARAHDRRQGARARCEGDTRRQRGVPPPRVGRVRRDRGHSTSASCWHARRASTT